MGLAIVVHDFGQVFARNAHEIGEIVVAGSDDELARGILASVAALMAGMHNKSAIAARDTFH